MVKYLEVDMGNGEIWCVPASLIASDRATYFANKDLEKGYITEDKFDETFEAEYMNGIDDDYEILDWASNNMNWSDVKNHAHRIPAPPLTEREYQEGWMNGERKITNIPEK